jgi:hypothetical protein
MKLKLSIKQQNTHARYGNFRGFYRLFVGLLQPEGPENDQLETGFSWFPHVFKQS